MLKRTFSTFANIALIKPNYIGLCLSCKRITLLHKKKSLCKHSPEWICSDCNNILKIIKINKKNKSLSKAISKAILKAEFFISKKYKKSLFDE